MKQLLSVFVLTLPIWLATATAQGVVQGVVTDEAGATLIAANVQIKGTGTGTTTDINGRYSLKPGPDDSVLVFSYIGYATKEVEIGDQLNINVMLITDFTPLDEVVVLGFGTSTRRKLTSSISSVDASAYDGTAKTNPIQALQGRIPGVHITQSSGATSSAMNVRIRGQTSINASNQPLVVIDGVITDTYTGWHFFGAGANKLIGIDPNDIESVEVLKDGAAAAIYGSRGANGVILITTKQGKFNTRPQITMSYQGGMSKPTVHPEVMTGPEYARAWNQAAEAIGGIPSEFLYPDPDAELNTNWCDVLTRSAMNHDAYISVSGGSPTTNYHIGAGYHNEEDYFITKDLKRYSLQVRVNQMISDQWQAGVSMNASRIDQSRMFEGGSISNSPAISSQWFPANVEAFDEQGNPNTLFINRSFSLNWSPYVDLTERQNLQYLSQIRTGSYVSYSPLSNLQFRTELNVEFSHLDFRDILSANTRFGKPDGFIYAESNVDGNYNWTNTATWTVSPLDDDELVLLVGNQMQWHNLEYQWVSGAGFADPRLQDLTSAGEITGGGTFGEQYRFSGYFARANYALANKYFIAASARVDGSSRFGSNNRWGFFPSLSAGWIISEESFFNAGNFDYLKISASIGKTGNAEIGNYENRALLGFSVSYNGTPGSAISSLGNNDLTWEETVQYDVSVGFGLWQDRLSGNVSLFLKNTDGLLFDLPLPSTNGVSSTFQNAGSVRNQGVEIDLRSTFKPAKNLLLRLGVNGAYINNKITGLPDTNDDGVDDDIIKNGMILRVGESLATYYLVRYAGVDPSNGDALFYDLEGRTIPIQSPLSNRVVAGRAVPDFIGGLSFDVEYRRFFISALFQTAMGHYIYVQKGPAEDGFLSNWNKARSQLDSWTPDNTQTDIPEARLYTDNGNEGQSTRWLEKGDYIRMKNIQVGYRFANLGSGTTALTLYLAGQNLLTVTGAKDIDPEVSSTDVNQPFGAFNSFSVALPRTISFGLKLEM